MKKPPQFAPFQGGPLKKMTKVVLLLAFTYAAVVAIALGRKDSATAAIGLLSLLILSAMTLVERFRYWNDLKKWSVESRIAEKR